VTGLIIEIERLKNEIKSLKEINEYKLKDKDNIIESREKEIESLKEINKHKLESKNKDIEILELKLQLQSK